MIAGMPCITNPHGGSRTMPVINHLDVSAAIPGVTPSVERNHSQPQVLWARLSYHRNLGQVYEQSLWFFQSSLGWGAADNRVRSPVLQRRVTHGQEAGDGEAASLPVRWAPEPGSQPGTWRGLPDAHVGTSEERSS